MILVNRGKQVGIINLCLQGMDNRWIVQPKQCTQQVSVVALENWNLYWISEGTRSHVVVLIKNFLYSVFVWIIISFLFGDSISFNSDY